MAARCVCSSFLLIFPAHLSGFQTRVGFYCAWVCARVYGHACRSFWGFQSLSKMMTVSAEVRLMPMPPALVPIRKMKRCVLSCPHSWNLPIVTGGVKDVARKMWC